MGGSPGKDGSWNFFACDGLAPCLSGSSSGPRGPEGVRRRRALDRADWDAEVPAQRLEDLTEELFQLHCLKGNAKLEEAELIQLNEMIAVLHSGSDADTTDVRIKYRGVFRSKLDPDGQPVPYEAFRRYAREVLNGLDTDPEAQEMILEQFVAEARSAREVFHVPAPARQPKLVEAGGGVTVLCPGPWPTPASSVAVPRMGMRKSAAVFLPSLPSSWLQACYGPVPGNDSPAARGPPLAGARQATDSFGGRVEGRPSMVVQQRAA
eukprot:TRINITY_DN24456_c0_g2_i1.p1 TRINITY_DN24456_c0_g2~~TRINITY_DN24456_c0_g2_i1.p1  ORF type:complete len:280 (-),score=50.06 TRINITY_DN24456_c0_g2_i1:44-838(-)